MNPDVVVDVGNTRIKWGLCSVRAGSVSDGVGAGSVSDGVNLFAYASGSVAKPHSDSMPMVSLPPNDPAAWQQRTEDWHLPAGLLWAVAGVHPHRRDALIEWLRNRGERVWLLDSYKFLPLRVLLPQPDKVGLDRLLNAVAANQIRNPKKTAILVDAGSAVTVDYVDETGSFRGGAIFPGLGLMSKALHAYTALLPLVEISGVPPAVGTSTVEAIQAGIFWSLLGGVRMLLEKQQRFGEPAPEIFCTGGNAHLLVPELNQCGWTVRHRPALTLDGLFLTAQEHGLSEKPA